MHFTVVFFKSTSNKTKLGYSLYALLNGEFINSGVGFTAP